MGFEQLVWFLLTIPPACRCQAGGGSRRRRWKGTTRGFYFARARGACERRLCERRSAKKWI